MWFVMRSNKKSKASVVERARRHNGFVIKVTPLATKDTEEKQEDPIGNN
jgi:hypothetical protein